VSGVRILVLQPSESDPPGALADWLRDAGAELDVLLPFRDSLPKSLEGYQAVVCLGGEMGAYDDARHPWLADVRRLLADAVSGRLPVLAICLGAQLLAVATGGQVRPGAQGPECGTLLVAKRDAASQDPLLVDLPFTPDVLQFHSDEIAQLPPGALLLAASPKYRNQAFRVGECAYGFQFHIETTPETVLRWVHASPDVAATAPPGQFEPDHLVRFHADLAETWQPVAARFVRLAAQYAGLLPGEPAPPRRLPLV